MDKLFKFIRRFPVILAVALFLVSTVICWQISWRFKDTNIFYLLNVSYLICVFLLVIGAIKYQNLKIGIAILLTAASILLVLTLIDFYLITFRYDTSGPGGVNVVTHLNWFNKFVTKNEYGFWERSLAKFEDPSKRNNELVIAVVGDSFTWGQGIQGNTFRLTEQLEKRLNSVPGAKQVTVLNFGKGGADTLQEKQIVDEYISKIHPDLVLVGYLANDIFSDSKDYSDIGEKLSTLTPTINFIYWRLVGPTKYQGIGLKYMNHLVALYNDKDDFKKHTDELTALFQDVKKMGAQPIFVLLPFPHMWKIFPKDTRDNIYKRITEAVATAGVPVIDLSHMENDYTLEEFQVSSFDGHPNAKMHEEFAKEIYRWLISHGEFNDLLKKSEKN